MRAMGRNWIQRMVHPQRLGDDALVGAILDMIERQTPERFEAQIEALLGRPDAAPVLRSIGCHTLVVCGRQDAWSPVAQHEEIAAMTPGAALAIIDDCGHMSPMEQPERVAQAMLEWLCAKPLRPRQRPALSRNRPTPSAHCVANRARHRHSDRAR
jgi:pimeloyl-ACP methyl ester carboxylesterase